MAAANPLNNRNEVRDNHEDQMDYTVNPQPVQAQVQTRLLDFDSDKLDVFRLKSLTVDQLTNLKKLLAKERAMDRLRSTVCLVCDKTFDSSHGTRLHAIKSHFYVLKQYKKEYGNYFEHVLNSV
jgi:hypothetical protein